MGIKVLEYAGYEADDILGTLARACSETNDKCFILTGDRDSLQLIDENVTVLLTTNKETIHYTQERFIADYGFQPANLIDFKALMGDSSDNISGVAGIGEKTASALIKEYTTIENLYNNYEYSTLTKSIKTKLEQGEKSARESKWLATIFRSVPIDTMIEKYIPADPDNESLYSLLADLEMFKVLDKLNMEVPEKQDDFQPVEITEKPLTAEDIDLLKECTYLLDHKKLYVRNSDTVFTTIEEDIIIKFLASPCEKSTDNAKLHYRYAMSRNSVLSNLKNDISICGYLLNSSGSDYSIRTLCTEYGVHYYTEQGNLADIVSLKPLLEKLLTKINDGNLTSLYENVEIPLTEVLASMEDTGIKIDKHGVEEFGEFLSVMISDAKKKIYNRAGHLFNISSPKQLAVVLI